MTSSAKRTPPVPVADKRLLTVREAAALCSWSTDTFRRKALDSGAITTWKATPLDEERIYRVELDRWLKEIQARREAERGQAQLRAVIGRSAKRA